MRTMLKAITQSAHGNGFMPMQALPPPSLPRSMPSYPPERKREDQMCIRDRLNDSPYDKGWLVRVKPDDADEGGRISAAEYAAPAG